MFSPLPDHAKPEPSSAPPSHDAARNKVPAHTKVTGAHGSEPTSVDMRQGKQSSGQPLAGGARESFEKRLGHDFSQVRVHNERKNADSARQHTDTGAGVSAVPGARTGSNRPASHGGDAALEQEAERVAARLAPDRALPGSSAASGIRSPQNMLAKAAVNTGISTPGEPIPGGITARIQPELNVDLNRVRIHRNATATGTAHLLGANGYAFGTHVVLGPDFRDINSTQGFAMLAHELTHVAQQTGFGILAPNHRAQFSLKTYISAMNTKPEPDWKTAAEHLNGEEPATIKQILKNLSPAYRVKLHEAARESPGVCSNVARLTEADYMAAHPEIKARASDTCDREDPVSPAADKPALQAAEDKPAPKKVSPPPALTGHKRVDAAIKLLKNQWDRYKADPQGQDVHKYVNAIRTFVEGMVTESKMSNAFNRLESYERRIAPERCKEALSQIKNLETAFRTGYPFLNDERTWKSAIGSMALAQRYLDMILDYRAPVPLKDGWHMIITEDGTVLGYLYLSTGVWKILDVAGKFIEGGEAGLEHPLIDPIDIAAGGIAGVIRGVVVGAIEGGLSTLARRAAPRILAATIAIDAGLDATIPGVIGRVAPRALIMAEALAADSVPAVVRNVGSALPKAAALQAVEQQGNVAVDTTVNAARARVAPNVGAGVASQATPGTGALSAASVLGATATSQIPGATAVPVSQAEYEARLGFVFPQQFDHVVLNAVERAGQQAATVLSNAGTPVGARFIQACQARQWALAGTLFHAEAARQLRTIAATLTQQGVQITAEDVVQQGAGGSRLDVSAVDAAGNHYNIDWKTTGRSALSAKARAELQRHAAQYAANRGAPLDVQISKSWVDFVRALIAGVTWPK